MKTIAFCRSFPFFISTACVVLIVSERDGAGAEPYQGAAAVLQKATEQSGKKPAEAKTTESAKLKSDLEQFGRSAANLSADAAAKEWLGLADRFFALPAEARMLGEDSEPISAEQLLAALPPPTAWEALSKTILARPASKKETELREFGLRLLGYSLVGDKAGREREIGALQTRGEKASRREAYLFRTIFDQLSEAMLNTMDDPDAVLKSLERRLARTTAEREAQIRIPNLVALVGEEKAAAFIRTALTKPKVRLEVESGTATARLAQKLALELIDQLTTPQWSLINSLDGVELYEAMDKKFAKAPKPPAARLPGLPDVPVDGDFGAGDYARNEAETYYFLGLISKGRAKDAVAIAQKLAKNERPSLPHEALEAMERSGYTRALDDFFFELLSQDAALPFWDEYVQLAAKAGRTERMLKLARSAASSDDVSRKKRASIHQNLFRALLADGQIEEGVAEMKRMLVLEPGVQSGGELSVGHLGIMLAQLGTLLQKPEWTEEGIKAARNSLTNAPNPRYGWAPQDVPGALANLLFDLNRGAEAESILADALAGAIREGTGRNEYSSGGDERPREMLAALAALYHRAGRHADVVALLDTAPWWGGKDLAELLDTTPEFSGMMAMRMRVRSHPAALPLPFVAASSLAALDRKAEARRINDAVLETYSGFDPSYELLLKLDAAGALGRLDELLARDQFEERPLIWKARLLADRKDHTQAEETIRRAIAIDPSDGEQGPGDRMRAYAILADIREARGDHKDANFFRGVVKAIRLSEEADKYYAAGLLKRAVAMYQQSLTLFADAYCIQSRLAVQLAELGLHDEAEAHYRRAYELMPDSFGRVESHCFGCERAFSGQRAQSLAEKVFTELAVKQPKKPQVHYLLGYLREEQDRHGEALPHFRTAVTLDPDYLNAWEKMLASAAHVHLPAAERDQIVFNLLRLDPLQRRTYLNLQTVGDLRGLWVAVENANKRQTEKPTALYSLVASKAALEKKEGAGNARMNRYRYRSFGGNDSRRTPGAAVAQTAFVQAAGQLLNHVSFEE